MKRARRSAEFTMARLTPPRNSRAIPTPRRRRRKSCATCSSAAMPGTAPAISCAPTRAAISISSIGSAIRFAGRARTWPTSEVAAAIMAFPGMTEATVYGVPVPGTEGAAGMAALVVDGALDLPEFRKYLARVLPAYARPLFLRIQDRIAVTATFKHQKTELEREGFDPTASDECHLFRRPVAAGLRAARPRAVRQDSGRLGASLVLTRWRRRPRSAPCRKCCAPCR